MSSKIITTVIVTAIVGPFAYIAVADAVSITQNLHRQEQQIQQLSTEYEQLDKELDQTVQTKQQSEAEVQQLEQEKADLANERQRLEQELGAN